MSSSAGRASGRCKPVINNCPIFRGLLHNSLEWIHLTGSVSYSRQYVEAFYPTLPHVELVPFQRGVVTGPVRRAVAWSRGLRHAREDNSLNL